MGYDTAYALPWDNLHDGSTMPTPSMPLPLKVPVAPVEEKQKPMPHSPMKPPIPPQGHIVHHTLPVAAPTPQASNVPTLEAKIAGWYILKTTLEHRKVCYAVNYPIETIGNHTNKRKAYIMITYLSPQQQEVSIASGYRYRLHSTVNLSIDGEQYTCISNGDLAWTRSAADDFKIINKMLSSIKVMTKAESVLNTYSVDIYLLNGFPEAYKKLAQVCQ